MSRTSINIRERMKIRTYGGYVKRIRDEKILDIYNARSSKLMNKSAKINENLTSHSSDNICLLSLIWMNCALMISLT